APRPRTRRWTRRWVRQPDRRNRRRGRPPPQGSGFPASPGSAWHAPLQSTPQRAPCLQSTLASVMEPSRGPCAEGSRLAGAAAGVTNSYQIRLAQVLWSVKVIPVPSIAGALLFQPTPHTDQRGFFSRTFDSEIVKEAGIDPGGFIQDSQSRSVR